MMKKLAIALSKGGVGKTTTAVNLSAGLAAAGKNVLLVDCDTQGQISRSLGVKVEHSLADVIAEKVKLQQAVVPAREHLYILAGSRELAGVKRMIDRKEFGGERTLTEALSAAENRFDYVILDTAPGWDSLTVNVLFYAEEILSPVAMEVLSLQGLAQFIRSLSAIQKYHKALQLRYILPTFLDMRVKKSTEILNQIQRHYGERLCSPIRYNVRLSEAPGYGQTIFEYASSSAGAEDYQKLTEKVMNNGT
jgi:chromosome partitioning protein